MTKKTIGMMALCAACMVAAVQAQSSSGGSSGGTSSDDINSQTGSGPKGADRQLRNPNDPMSGHQGLSPTGRMGGHQEVRATKLTGADVQNSSGQTLGTIDEILVNPASGRVDFAVISLSAASGSSGESSSSSTAASSMAGQLVPVPWSLLRSSAGSSSSSSPAGASEQQPSFVFTGDSSKLQSAPSFSQNSWPDITQPAWRHSIFSYYGMTPGTATGGSEMPGASGSERGGSRNNQPQY